MRTTLNIADDVLLAAKERARREKKSLGDVVSALMRVALKRSRDVPDSAQDSFFGFEPLPSTGRTVSNALIEKLREEESV